MAQHRQPLNRPIRNGASIARARLSTRQPPCAARQTDFSPASMQPNCQKCRCWKQSIPAKGWRKVEGMGRGNGVMIADAQGAPWSANISLAPGQSGISLGILPMFPDGDDRAQDRSQY
jgi:hypothetical protein